MKLTNEHLRKIIKEELENVLSEAIPTEYPGLENQPSQFFRAMNDYLGKWFKQNKEMWESDSRLRNALVKLHGGLQNVIKDDSKENAAAASKSMIDLNTFYPEIADELVSNAEKTFDKLTIGR